MFLKVKFLQFPSNSVYNDYKYVKAQQGIYWISNLSNRTEVPKITANRMFRLAFMKICQLLLKKKLGEKFWRGKYL